jgi:hypothetical protein
MGLAPSGQRPEESDRPPRRLDTDGPAAVLRSCDQPALPALAMFARLAPLTSGGRRTRGAAAPPVRPGAPISKQSLLGEGGNGSRGHDEVVQHAHIHQRQCRLQRLRQVLIGPARLG